MNFGTNLRNLRVQRHLTQQKLADDMQISQASVAAYESGTREPSFNTVRRFADYFHVAPSTLMPFEEITEEEFAQRVASSFITNDKIRLIFERVRFMSDYDLDAVLAVVNAISGKREDIE